MLEVFDDPRFDAGMTNQRQSVAGGTASGVVIDQGVHGIPQQLALDTWLAACSLVLPLGGAGITAAIPEAEANAREARSSMGAPNASGATLGSRSFVMEACYASYVPIF